MSHTDTRTKQQERKLVRRTLSKEVILRKQYVAQKPLWRRPIIGYVFSFPIVGLALGCTLFLRHFLQHLYFPSSFMLLAVLGVALLWGVGPSLFAIFLSCLTLDYFFIAPFDTLSFYTRQDTLQLLPFVVSGLIVALITAQRERARLSVLATEQELQERAEELEEANQKLQETNNLKDRFISIASHELKTPITTIRGQAQLVLRRLAKQRECSPEMDGMHSSLVKINEQTGRLTMLIDELLEVSSLRAGKAQLKKKEYDIIAICRGVAEDQCLLTERQVLVEAPDTPIKMLIDGDRVAQVLVNLVSNAIKYSPEEYPVEVVISKVDRGALIQVCDHGKGIARDQQAHIFETFYRTPDAQSSAKFGLGLGLAISKDIVERHNGRIWCESEPGKGSTFFVELPLK